MNQFVLRYNGSSLTPAANLDSIRSTPGVQILDESPRMLLVGGDESTLQAKLKDLPDWSLHSLNEVPLPDTRKKIS
jgi:hypothetical protein